MMATRSAGEQVGPVAASSTASRRVAENLQSLNFAHLLYFWTVARDGSISSACERLHVSQPTISMQIRKLEKTLGHRLFDRTGRSLVLTDVGRTVFEYADEMFSLGRELLGTLRGLPGKHTGRLHVGIPTFLPKLITYRLLEPVLQMSPPVQLVCHEAEFDELVSGLARHRFDVILTDTPLHAAAGNRCYSHALGECDIAFCGAASLARRYRHGFPNSLRDAPLLLPSGVTEMRRVLDRWFDQRSFDPRIVAEFDDSALMKEFGGGGSGLFPVPMAVLAEVERQYGVELVAQLTKVRVQYFVVTSQRKLTHPATQLIVQTAKLGLLYEAEA